METNLTSWLTLSTKVANVYPADKAYKLVNTGFEVMETLLTNWLTLATKLMITKTTTLLTLATR